MGELRAVLDELKLCAARHDATGIKAVLKAIVPEYTPQQTEAVLKSQEDRHLDSFSRTQVH
jgi:hypothetical protein